MQNNALRRQWGAAVLLGSFLPALTLLCGFSWSAVLLGALPAAGLLYWLGHRDCRERRSVQGKAACCGPRPVLGKTASCAHRLLASAGALFALLLAARLAAISPQFFPQSGGAPWIGLGVLVLAAVAADRGPAVVLRCAALLLVPVCGIFGATLLLALPQLRLRWLAPTLNAGQVMQAAAMMLGLGLAVPFRIVGASIARPSKFGAKHTSLTQEAKPISGEPSSPLRHTVRGFCGVVPMVAVLFSVVAAAICGGCLSPAIAAGGQGFLILSRSLSLFGVMLRLEALVYGALTACVFVVCALLLCLAKTVFPEKKWARALPGLLCAALLVPSLCVPRSVLLSGVAVFGVLYAAKTQMLVVKTR